MTFKDIFSNSFSKIIQFLLELGIFVIQPRKYFSIISNEDAANSIRRIIIYTIFYVLVSISLFLYIVVGKKPLNLYVIASATIFEMILSLLYLPVFILAGRLCKPKVTFKVALFYVLTYRYVFSLIIILFYGMFLLFENYIFAIFRGITLYAYVLMMFLMFPFLFSYGIKSRSFVIVVTFSLFVITTFLFGTILTWQPSRRTAEISTSALFDPIGKEIDELENNLDQFSLVSWESFSKKFFEDPNKVSSFSFSLGYSELQKNRLQYLKELQGELHFLDSLKPKQLFVTTQDLIELKKTEVLQEISFLNHLWDLFNTHPSADYKKDIDKKITAILKTLTKSVEARTSYISQINGINKIRLDLFRYRLISVF